MKITFLGGADEVGASCSLLEIAGKKILVDAGIRISPKSSRGIEADQLPDLHPITKAGGPDYIIVTHAHTDHTAALPLIMEQYPHTPVLMTRPTEALVRVLQKDAQRIMKSRYDEEGELPMFDEVAVDRLLDAVQLVEFKQAVKLGEGLQVTYHIAGHIAGAAMLVFESSEGIFVMSGDISKSPQRTVESVRVPKIKADAVVMESTYGGRLHANREAEERRLIRTLKEITDEGGRVLIPAFALGRSQEIIQIIHAFEEEIDVPVYVDGMVRSVCDAYARFSDLVPEKTVEMAGDEHLFFRGNVKPIRSTAMRHEVANRVDPCIVIASSGMLTGGASVFYASHFASDERSAILLTGYQDEESPGRFLQTIMRKQDRGETPFLKLGDKKVPLHCHIDTYSLSAHGDESELIAVAEAFEPEEIMLVHGDGPARHSLASSLRQRERIVSTPVIGTERTFQFKERPWAVGTKIPTEVRGTKVELPELWGALKAQAGSYFTDRELAQVWWGDGDRAGEMKTRLSMADNIYFSADWRNRSTFKVQTPQMVATIKRRREIMLEYPDIIGKLVVLRNTNGQPRLGVVKAGHIDSFEAIVQGAKGSKYPADALLWVIGPWSGVEGHDGGVKSQLSALLKEARARQDSLIDFADRRRMAEKEEVVNPEDLLPEELPEGLDRQTALIAIVLTLAADHAELVEGGLKPTRAHEHGPLEQNEARELALSIFPDEAGLRKVGMDVHRQKLLLNFDFPQAAMREYGDVIEDLIEQSGWDVSVRPQVNQGALGVMLERVLPDGAQITKGPSFYMDKREVGAQINGLDQAARKEAEKEFHRRTDFRLVIEAATVIQPEKLAEELQPLAEGQQMEINAAYGVIKAALTPHGLYKAGQKQGAIVLSFISPQQGQKHQEIIDELSKKTGYTMKIHPHPNQQKIMETAQKLAAAAGWTITKGPSLHTHNGTIAISIDGDPLPGMIDAVREEMEEQTGYKLAVE